MAQRTPVERSKEVGQSVVIERGCCCVLAMNDAATACLRHRGKTVSVTVAENLGENGSVGHSEVWLTFAASSVRTMWLGAGLDVRLSTSGQPESQLLADSLVEAGMMLQRKLAAKPRIVCWGEEERGGCMSANVARPLYDRVIIKRVEGRDRTEGGLYIPENAKEKANEGLVVAVGPGRVLKDGRRVEPQVKVGDRVLFGKYTAPEVRLDDEEVLILREDEVLAVVEP